MTDWGAVASVLAKFLGPVIPILTFLFGKATKGGANQIMLDQVCTKVDSLEKIVADHTAIIASLTTLHEGYKEDKKALLSKLDATSTQLSELSGYIRGKEK